MKIRTPEQKDGYQRSDKTNDMTQKKKKKRYGEWDQAREDWKGVQHHLEAQDQCQEHPSKERQCPGSESADDKCCIWNLQHELKENRSKRKKRVEKNELEK